MTMFKNARVLDDATSNETDIFIEYVQNHLNAVIDYENAETDKEKRITVK
jgi:5'-nucleotidase/UDP-sugar diphosphatase